LLGYVCDPKYKSPQVCANPDSDCPGGSAVMQCSTSGYCELIPNQSSCPTGYTLLNAGGYCVPTDVCNVINNVTGVPNQTCSATGAGAANQCATRDATAGVGLKCNGRGECIDLNIGDFGTLPCPNIKPTACIAYDPTTGAVLWQASRASGSYCGLPYNPGWPGGPPKGSTPQGGGTQPSSSLGYTLHGIYACV
jgi:hypothetical protein